MCVQSIIGLIFEQTAHVVFTKYTIGELKLQKTRSPIFPCPCSRASSSQVQLHLDNRFLGNSNSPLIRTESESPGLTSYIYCKFNLENSKPRSQQCFAAPFLCISPMIPFTASDFMLCLSEIQSLNALRISIFRQLCGAQWTGMGWEKMGLDWFNLGNNEIGWEEMRWDRIWWVGVGWEGLDCGGIHVDW